MELEFITLVAISGPFLFWLFCLAAHPRQRRAILKWTLVIGCLLSVRSSYLHLTGQIPDQPGGHGIWPIYALTVFGSLLLGGGEFHR